jgi:hypothetical protein
VYFWSSGSQKGGEGTTWGEGHERKM